MRRENWPALLQHHIRIATFAWGENDCVLWCAEWINTVTGEDYAKEFRAKYSTEAEAQRLLADLGATCAADLADKYLPPIGVSFAQRGDIVLHPEGAIGICDGQFSHFLTVDGLSRLGTLKCLKAWRV